LHPIGYTVDCDLCRPVAGTIPPAAETDCVLSRRLFASRTHGTKDAGQEACNPYPAHEDRSSGILTDAG
jgi:hypothetical protein